MSTYTYAIETSDDGLPAETPLKVWEIVTTGIDQSNDWASTYGSQILARYLWDHMPEGGWEASGLDVRIAVWTREPLEDIRMAAAVVYA